MSTENGGLGEQWKQVYAVGFAEGVNREGREARREQVDRVVRGWKAQGMFKEVLGGWRDEEYDIYGPPAPSPAPAPAPSSTTAESSKANSSPSPRSNVAFSMERSACALFGVATFGVHMTAYIEEEGQPLKFWVPRRSATKQTWPSYLDNTVAGGISAGSTPYSTILREAIEEASLPPSFVASRIHGSSVLVYNYRTADGWLQPEVQYVYDLRMDAPREGTVRPGVNDGEVQEFMLMDLGEVVDRMVKGEFKPNCAIVLLDFFLRHGYLTPENDSRFLEVAMRLRRTLALPGPA
ncbi:NUDIX hydrolase domain-like protein [Leucosporidium creatinivorum]|uniref:NUDIX hydrolase domain-like protein n=1 Tax=Leucosporidium creatinivorum TaxID=106004 RepID=A0A1Y2ESI7_9BASI|nr:NUDIX hydrolase domain-like protein [Leucosporidium creatinivorum]